MWSKECVLCDKPTEDGAHDDTNTCKKLRSGGDVRLGYAQSCMVVGVIGKVLDQTTAKCFFECILSRGKKNEFLCA